MNWIALLGLDGLLARWRAVGAEGAEAMQDRLELAQLEWQQQKRQWAKMLAFSLAVLALAVLSLVVFSMALIIQFWDSPQRSLVAWLLTGFWFMLWASSVVALISVVAKGGNAFGLTRRELKQDWQDIKDQLP
jgi:uncharacterized membrane protein YqjE